jgi:hypothetical protein
MPRSCTICTHAERAAIEGALHDAVPFRTIADLWSVSKWALIRHKQEHRIGKLTSGQPASRGTPRDREHAALTAASLSAPPSLFPAISHPKKRAFLMAFVLCGRRGRAAAMAGVDVRNHWWWLAKDPAYQAAFAQAEQMAADIAEDETYRRGIEGVEEGIWYKGERVGTEMKYSDTVLLAILNAGKPQKYKYRSDTTHDLSPAMQVIFERLEELRNTPPPPRALDASCESEGDAAADQAQDGRAGLTPLPQPPSGPQDDRTYFAALDEANRLPLDDDEDDEVAH